MVAVYEFLQNGTAIGCGTKMERDYWAAEGVMTNVELGRILTHEPATMDEKRKALWAK